MKSPINWKLIRLKILHMNPQFKIIALFAFASLLFAACGSDGGGGGTNDDNMVPDVRISVSDVTIFEGDDPGETINFKVRLTAASSEVVRVDYRTEDAAAIAGEDYEAVSGTLSFDVNETELIVEVPILTDTLKEGDEDFILILENPVNAGFSRDQATGTLRNDDEFLATDGSGYSTPLAYAGMTLVWQDEFDGSEIDPDNWTHELGNSGWGNNELQNYTSRSENSYISDGKLVIEAKEEDLGGSNYTSARMISAGKQEFAWGRIDIRAKLPKGQGIWPAIWMLGANFFDVGWPACGEIDIMELVGHEPNIIHGTAHWGPQGQSWSFNEGNAFALQGGAEFIDEFNVFSIIWENNSIKWLMNDQQYFSLTPATTGGQNYPFNQEFFFILNIAVGGNWPGNPDATTEFPQRMFVDYIRVFQEN